MVDAIRRTHTSPAIEMTLGHIFSANVLCSCYERDIPCQSTCSNGVYNERIDESISPVANLSKVLLYKIYTHFLLPVLLVSKDMIVAAASIISLTQKRTNAVTRSSCSAGR